MSLGEELRGRVTERHIDAQTLLVTVRCHAATLNGKRVEFAFTLPPEDARHVALQIGNRVFYSTHGALGVWGSVSVPGWESQRIVVDSVQTMRKDDARQAMFGPDSRPPIALERRVRQDAARMGFEVEFVVEAEQSYVEIQVPGRGKVKHYKDNDDSWEEVLMAAGLGGTI